MWALLITNETIERILLAHITALSRTRVVTVDAAQYVANMVGL
jgi:hypothetical protein